MRTAGVVLCLLLATSACTSDAPGQALPAEAVPTAPATSRPSPSPTGPPAATPTAAPRALSSPSPQTQRCVSAEQGYALTFPADWHVAGGGVEACAFFDPEPLRLEPGTEADGVAVRVDVLAQPYAQARPAVEDDGPVEDVRETTVDGRQAVRLEARTSGEDLLPPGLRTTTWLVDLGSSTLLATTADVPRLDYEAAVQVLDAMAASVEAS